MKLVGGLLVWGILLSLLGSFEVDGRTHKRRKHHLRKEAVDFTDSVEQDLEKNEAYVYFDDQIVGMLGRPCWPSIGAKVDDVSSVNKLFLFAYLESVVYQQLKHNFNHSTFSSIDASNYQIQRYLNEYGAPLPHSAISQPASSIAEKAKGIFADSLSMFKTVRRLTFDLPSIVKSAGSDMLSGWWDSLMGFLPDETDLMNVHSGLLSIQQVHSLSALQIVDGEFSSQQWQVAESESTLSVSDCIALGKHAQKIMMFEKAIEWFQTALVLSNEGAPDPVHASTVAQLIQQTQEQAEKAAQFDAQCVKDDEAKGIKKMEKPLRSFNFYDLCRRKNYQTAGMKSELKCMLDSRLHPYWTIQPLKKEMISVNPPITLIHDLMGEERMGLVHRVARESLQRNPESSSSEIIGNVTGGDELLSTDFESPLNLIADEIADEQLGSYYRRLSLATGLVVRQKLDPAFKTADYGTMGSQCNLHWDSGELGERNQNLMATMMLYLSDVVLGGETAFPKLATTIGPSKGSLLFWYNLHKNGTVNRETLHGGCPIVLGRKLIANKWAHYNDNLFTRPCSLNSNE